MNKNIKQLFATLALQVGINFRKGQCLKIRVSMGNYDYALSIAEEAYRMGGRYVRIEIIDNNVIKMRALHSQFEDLSYVPRDLIAQGEMELEEDWANIRIDNTEELDVLQDISPLSLREMTKHYRKSLHFVSKALMRHKHSWLVLAVPGPNWARKVYGLSKDASDAEVQTALEKLEKVFISILRLNEKDPIATWKKQGKVLIERAQKLTEMKLDRLHFQSKLMDFTVGLAKNHQWRGGPSKLPDGRWYEPNLPSEEVFTAPDLSRAEGFVRVVRPVSVLANLVEGAWFRFHEGLVVEWGAEKNKEILDQFFDIDEGARRLGEVALVDVDNPISRSGLIFGSILFDENASCHIAFGAAYPICISDSDNLNTSDELRSAGCNVSTVHTDFMISDDSTNVTGYLLNNQAIPIIQNGKFLI